MVVRMVGDQVGMCQMGQMERQGGWCQCQMCVDDVCVEFFCVGLNQQVEDGEVSVVVEGGEVIGSSIEFYVEFLF